MSASDLPRDGDWLLLEPELVVSGEDLQRGRVVRSDGETHDPDLDEAEHGTRFGYPVPREDREIVRRDDVPVHAVLAHRGDEVLDLERRFQRPQHVIRGSWRKFDTQLILKDGIDLDQLPPVDEHGLKLQTVAPVQSEALRRILDEHEN